MFKDFTKDFDFLLKKLEAEENFAFTRFSDGELFIMQNKSVILAENHFVTGEVSGANIYTEEEQKEFSPERDGFYREKLIECYKHNQENYFKGICTGTDLHVGNENFKWMIDFHGEDHDNLTFSNLLINGNYNRFIEEMVPLFANREILYVAHKNAQVDQLPFEIKHVFTIGSNCMINNYDTAEKVRAHIKEKKLTNHIVLCSAATLSNYVIHRCFKEDQSNTFIDIGSCLNPLLSLEGWKHTRGYLTSYWLNSNSPFGSQVDIWPNTN